MIKYFKKICNKFFWLIDKLNKRLYKKWYPKYLKWLGIDISLDNTEETWISPTVFFDSSDYGKIQIGQQVTISFDVAILVHDYSIVHAARTINKDIKHIIFKNVQIGNNVFIGAKTLILPGTIIQDGCIIGGVCSKRNIRKRLNLCR